MANNDLRTEAIVVRRTNYGETDRIVNFLTPTGKVSALARSARKEKSKLAGGIEMFCLSEITIHQKNGDTSALAILTSAKTKVFYQKILGSLDALELGSKILSEVSRAAESFDSPELFNLTIDCLSALDRGLLPFRIIESYFRLKLATICGEDINLIHDNTGTKLNENSIYIWDGFEKVFAPSEKGNISSEHIKILRLFISTNLAMLEKIKNLDQYSSEIFQIAKDF